MKESVEMTTKKNGDISKNVHNNPSFEADNTLSPESVRPMTEFIHLTVHQVNYLFWFNVRTFTTWVKSYQNSCNFGLLTYIVVAKYILVDDQIFPQPGV